MLPSARIRWEMVTESLPRYQAAGPARERPLGHFWDSAVVTLRDIK